MENKYNQTFVDGFRLFNTAEGVPEFVIAKGTIDVQRFARFVKEYIDEDGQIKFDIKRSKEGKLYAALDTFVRKEEDIKSDVETVDVDSDKEEIDIENISF